ncbi:Mur ligase domain-containing protein [Actinoplanes hulinensis]|uniref:Mur ligase domain-containing protein n=1 Tax=Actinoplanes hulinensis TaxID=1144547 RepID=UPI001FE422EB|nr:Mur ligase domain-containing protein [Actinoplanes hulinensis]
MADTVTGNPTLGAYTGPIDLSRPHFVGVGGSAMSGLAQLCAARGALVSGTDAADSDRITALRAAGCKVEIGHDPRAIEDASCVVYTTVAQHAPEVAAARANGIPVVHRAQVLRELAGRHLVAVAGTHGKSTTAGILVAALRQLGQDPSFVVGADLDVPGSGSHHGTGPLFVAEADESDRSFHFLEPAAAVITTIAHDHPENFDGLDSHLIAYVTFAARLRPEGVLIANADEPASNDVLARVRRLRPDVRVVTFGQSERADVRFGPVDRHGWQSMTEVHAGNGRGVLRLGTPSIYHVQDAVAAVALLVAFGYPIDAAAQAA